MQASNAPKSSKGTVGVESFQGRLRLRLPRQWYGGKQKYLTLGLSDTPENRVIAETKATQIAVDYKLGQFDVTLDKYKPVRHLEVVSNPTTSKMTLLDVWMQYLKFKSTGVGSNTMRYVFGPITNKLKKLPPGIGIADGPKLRDYLLKQSPPDAVKRTLMHLNACMKWAKKSGLIGFNSFDGLASDVKVPKSQQSDEFEIHPFTREERDAIIAAFESNQFHPKRANHLSRHSHYAPYVKFLFFTGCRPSEAIGLQWKHIKEDRILFQQSVIKTGDGLKIKSGLKTQNFRYFPINTQLRTILDAIKPENASPDDFVFPSPTGKHIDISNFRLRVWKPILEGLGIEYRKPYQTRHTFITLCLENGIDAKDVAKWVGNSPEIIYKHYASAKKELDVPEL